MPKLGTLNDPAFLIFKKSTLFLTTECVNFRINCYFTFIERNILFTLICHPSFSHKAWCQSLLLPCNHYQVLLYFDQLKKKNAPSLNSTFHVTFNISNLRGRVIIKLKQIKLSLSISYISTNFCILVAKRKIKLEKINLKIWVCLFVLNDNFS